MQKIIFIRQPNNSSVHFLTVIVLVSVMLFSSCRKNTTGEFSVKYGPFKQSVTESGELEAVNASNIVMPQLKWEYGYRFKIVGLAQHGKVVHKGDSVVAIDGSSIYKFIIERESMLENEIAASKKQKVQMENNIQELQAQMKNEQAAYDLKKLELERTRFDTENKRKIKELEFQQSTIRLEKVKRNLKLKPILENYDTRTQQIKVVQRESELREAKQTLKRLVLRSPQDGIFQITMSRWSGQYVRLGDNSYMGDVIASIPDIKTMKANTWINESDFRKIKPGMKVIVRLDALPKVPFHGSITKIGKICTDRESEKVFEVEVEIAESDIRLKPGMTVSCEYLCFESENSFYVPNNCLLKEGGRYYIFLDRARSPLKKEVKAGPSNSNYTAVTGDLKTGQRLVPFETVMSKTNN